MRHGLGGGGDGREGKGAAGGIVPAQAAPSPPEGVPAIEMAADEDRQAGAGAAAALLRDLQDDAIEGDRVVAGDDPRLFVTEDGLELGRSDGDERRGRIRREADRRSR